MGTHIKKQKRCGFGFRDIDRQSGASDSALDILDRRYASGEINKAEYEEVKRTLTHAKPINPEQSSQPYRSKEASAS